MIMAPGALALPGFYNNEPHSNHLYGNIDSGGVASFFGDNSSVFGSPGMSWSGHELSYSSCCSSYNTPGASFDFACASPLSDEPQLVYPTEEDNVNLLGGDDASEFLQRFSGCNQPVMHPNLVDTLKNLVTPLESPETPYFEHQELNQYQWEQQEEQERRAVQFLEQQLGLTPESPQMSPSDESGLSSQDVTFSVDSDEDFVKHEPPPLNNKVEPPFSRRFKLFWKIHLYSSLNSGVSGGIEVCVMRHFLTINCGVGRAEDREGGVHRR